MSNLPYIYCISLPNAFDRRSRMNQRLKMINTNYEFVDGIYHDSQIVDWYISKFKHSDEYGDNVLQFRKDIACFAAHIAAVKKFYGSGRNVALICEDDTLFHNNFNSRFADILSELPANTPLLSLCYMLSGAIDQTVVNGHFWRINSDYVWSGNLYYITREYAKIVLKLYNNPLEMWASPRVKVTSEHIIRYSCGYMAAIPLAIEDGIDSCRDSRDLPYHLKHYAHWGYTNYNKGDPEGLSPLKNTTPADAWKGYPFAVKGTKCQEVNLATDRQNSTKTIVKISLRVVAIVTLVAIVWYLS